MTVVNKSYVLGEFELEPDSRRLSFNGEPIHLRKKPFGVLLYLIENRERMVSRHELLDNFWDGHEVYEETLTKSVSAIRKVLNDSSDEPRFIHTQWAEGYQFIHPVEEKHPGFEIVRTRGIRITVEEDTESELQGKRQPIDDTKLLSRLALKKRAVVLSIVCLLSVLAFGGLFFFRGDRPAGSIHSIAILPLKNLTGDTANDYLSDGITEGLIASVSRIESLTVIARNSSFTNEKREIDSAEAGNKLNVETVLTGSVQKEGETLRVNLQLIKVSDRLVLWTKVFYKPINEALALQNEIVRDLVQRLNLQSTQNFAHRETNDPRVYELYLKGRYFWNKRTPDDLQKSVRYFDQAISLDANYAPAYAGLADSYQLLSINKVLPVTESYAKSRIAATKALEIDPTLAEALTALAYIQAFYDWDWTNAENSFQRAISQNPNYATAHQRYSELLSVLGRFDEAIAEIERARRLDPLSPIILGDIFATYYYMREFDKSLEQCRRMLELSPDFFWTHICFHANYFEKGMERESMEELAEMDRGFWGKAEADELMKAYDKNGLKGFWRKRLEQTESPARQKYVLAWDKAVIHLFLGDKDKVFYWLEKSYEQRDRWIITLKYQPQFDSIRSDARYDNLLKRMGLN